MVYSALVSADNQGVISASMHALESLSYAMTLSLGSSCNSLPPPPTSPSVSSSLSHITNPYNVLNQLIITLEHPFLDSDDFAQVLRNVLQASDKLSLHCRIQLVHWFKSVSEERLLRYCYLVSGYITKRISKRAASDAKNGAKFLALLHLASSTVLKCMDSSRRSVVFYNPALCEYLRHGENTRAGAEHLKLEYKLWISDLAAIEAKKPCSDSVSGGGGVGSTSDVNVDLLTADSFISFPFLLTPTVKALVLELDASVQMRRGISQEYNNALASGSEYMVPYLVLRVRRSHLLIDTLNHFVFLPETEYKKPLKVVFDGEEGVDMGGVRKEFFQVHDVQYTIYMYCTVLYCGCTYTIYCSCCTYTVPILHCVIVLCT